MGTALLQHEGYVDSTVDGRSQTMDGQLRKPEREKKLQGKTTEEVKKMAGFKYYLHCQWLTLDPVVCCSVQTGNQTESFCSHICH